MPYVITTIHPRDLYNAWNNNIHGSIWIPWALRWYIRVKKAYSKQRILKLVSRSAELSCQFIAIPSVIRRYFTYAQLTGSDSICGTFLPMVHLGLYLRLVRGNVHIIISAIKCKHEQMDTNDSYYKLFIPWQVSLVLHQQNHSCSIRDNFHINIKPTYLVISVNLRKYHLRFVFLLLLFVNNSLFSKPWLLFSMYF